jgi:hypothetical protein
MIKLKVFEVQTYYPAFRRDRVNQPGYTKDGTGMSDLNGYSVEGGYSDYFINLVNMVVHQVSITHKHLLRIQIH